MIIDAKITGIIAVLAQQKGLRGEGYRTMHNTTPAKCVSTVDEMDVPLPFIIGHGIPSYPISLSSEAVAAPNGYWLATCDTCDRGGPSHSTCHENRRKALPTCWEQGILSVMDIAQSTKYFEILGESLVEVMCKEPLHSLWVLARMVAVERIYVLLAVYILDIDGRKTRLHKLEVYQKTASVSIAVDEGMYRLEVDVETPELADQLRVIMAVG